MKANELMIDSLVYCESINRRAKVREIYTTVEPPFVKMLRLADNGLTWCVTLDEVSPIPLTPEILEKNGWNIDMYSTFELENEKWLEYYHHERRLRLLYSGIDEWENCEEVKELIFQCHCTYVHEFQRALRCCNLNDLADNFKI